MRLRKRKRNAVYTGVVLEARDPKQAGRVRISLPAFREETWARVATFAAGDHRGSWFVPDPGDEVVIAFEAGDVRRPFIIGSCWGTATPPESAPERKVLRTPNGATIVFDDGAGAIEIEDANGNAVVLTTAGITITAAAKLSLAAGRLKISAGMIEVDAGMSRFSGTLQCETLIATSVVSSNYTPGTGNVL